MRISSPGGGGTAQWESTGGTFTPVTTVINAGDQILYRARETDGATQIAHKFTNANALSTAGAKIASWYSDDNVTERASLDYLGNFTAGAGATGRGYVIGGSVNDVGAKFENAADGSGVFFVYFSSNWREVCNLTKGGVWLDGASSNCNSAFRVRPQSAATPYTVSGFFLDADDFFTGDSYLHKTAVTRGEMIRTYDAVEVENVTDRVQTTDATTTTVWAETLNDNSVHVIQVLVVARRTDAAGRWSGMRRVTVYRAGGGATLEGAVETIGTDVANGIAPTVTLDASGNDVRLRVTGEAAKTIQWRGFVSKVHSE